MKTNLFVFAIFVALLVQVAAAQQRGRSYPPKFAGATVETYKTAGEVKLTMSIFSPAGHKATDKRPAILFFFGGGFVGGSPAQFHQHCRYFASRGMVAITADYRVRKRHKTKPADSMQDGKDAMRYVRANAKRLGIDPERIVASGGSAGATIAACVGVIPNLDAASTEKKVSYTPGAMVLFNPAIMGKTAIERTNPDGSPAFPKSIMPWYHVREGLPPSIMFFGTDDRLMAGAKEFREAARSKGNRCELVTWEGVGHGFFNFGRGGNKHFVETLKAADKFLASLGYVKGEPTVDEFVAKQINRR